MDDERVNEEKGQAIFAEFGGNTQYLEGIQQTLGLLDDGVKQKAVMFEAFEKFNLLEPMVLDIKIDDEKTVKFEGYHSVSFERLNQLNANELDSLNKLGLLSIAFAVAVSLNNFDKLVRLKRQG